MTSAVLAPSLQATVDRFARSLIVPSRLLALHPRKQANPGNAAALAPAIKARGAARMGNRVLALDALDQIQAVQGDVDGYDDITEFGGLFSFPSAKQEYYLGSTFGLLGEHDKAEQHATAAIAAYENGLPAERSYGDEALARLDVVNSRLERGEVDGAVEAAAPVLGLPAERRIRQLDTAVGRTWRILQQPRFTSSTAARTLLDDLRQYRDQAARERSALPSA